MYVVLIGGGVVDVVGVFVVVVRFGGSTVGVDSI